MEDEELLVRAASAARWGVMVMARTLGGWEWGETSLRLRFGGRLSFCSDSCCSLFPSIRCCAFPASLCQGIDLAWKLCKSVLHLDQFSMQLAAWLYRECVNAVKGEGEPQERLRWEVLAEPWLGASAKIQAVGEIRDALTARGGRREEKWKPMVNAGKKWKGRLASGEVNWIIGSDCEVNIHGQLVSG